MEFGGLVGVANVPSAPLVMLLWAVLWTPFSFGIAQSTISSEYVAPLRAKAPKAQRYRAARQHAQRVSLSGLLSNSLTVAISAETPRLGLNFKVLTSRRKDNGEQVLG